MPLFKLAKEAAMGRSMTDTKKSPLNGFREVLMKLVDRVGQIEKTLTSGKRRVEAAVLRLTSSKGAKAKKSQSPAVHSPRSRKPKAQTKSAATSAKSKPKKTARKSSPQAGKRATKQSKKASPAVKRSGPKSVVEQAEAPVAKRPKPTTPWSPREEGSPDVAGGAAQDGVQQDAVDVSAASEVETTISRGVAGASAKLKRMIADERAQLD